jgi:phosphatidylglycerol:prolipoprotein diacylglycerol transferase
VFRFSVEFFREPDRQIGFDVFDWMTRGQILCLPMIIVGALILAWAHRRGPSARAAAVKS